MILKQDFQLLLPSHHATFVMYVMLHVMYTQCTATVFTLDHCLLGQLILRKNTFVLFSISSITSLLSLYRLLFDIFCPAWKTVFIVSSSADLLAMNSHSFCSHDNIFLFH
jgi:hypothetical protein